MLATLLSPYTAISAEVESYDEDIRLEFTLPDFTDKTHTLADYKDKVILVNFWASWCPPCIYEMPELTQLKQQMADKPFEIIAINVGEKKYRVRKFAKLINFELTVLLDTSNETFHDWGVQTLPTSFLVDTTGRVRYRIRGNPGWQQKPTVTLIESLMPQPVQSAAPNQTTNNEVN